jgi:hypothetical protein
MGFSRSELAEQFANQSNQVHLHCVALFFFATILSCIKITIIAWTTYKTGLYYIVLIRNISYICTFCFSTHNVILVSVCDSKKFNWRGFFFLLLSLLLEKM